MLVGALTSRRIISASRSPATADRGYAATDLPGSEISKTNQY